MPGGSMSSSTTEPGIPGDAVARDGEPDDILVEGEPAFSSDPSRRAAGRHGPAGARPVGDGCGARARRDATDAAPADRRQGRGDAGDGAAPRPLGRQRAGLMAQDAGGVRPLAGRAAAGRRSPGSPAMLRRPDPASTRRRKSPSGAVLPDPQLVEVQQHRRDPRRRGRRRPAPAPPGRSRPTAARCQRPARRAASMSQTLSPTTEASAMGDASRSAAARNRSGSGLACVT